MLNYLPHSKTDHASLAQPVEQLIRNQQVGCSSHLASFVKNLAFVFNDKSEAFLLYISASENNVYVDVAVNARNSTVVGKLPYVESVFKIGQSIVFSVACYPDSEV